MDIYQQFRYLSYIQLMHTVPVVNCTSFEYTGGMLTVALDYGPQILPPNQLTVFFTHVGSTQIALNKTMDANNLTVALAHGDLDSGWYTIDIQASNNIGLALQLARCENPMYVAEEGMCGHIIILYYVT